MLFLGAGASRPFDIQDLRGMTQIIKENLSSKLRNLVDTVENILLDKKYQSLNLQLDLEILYTTFDHLVHRQEALKELGPFVVVLDSLVRNKHSNLSIEEGEFTSFQKIVADTLISEIEKFNRNSNNQTKAWKLYDSLFGIVPEHGQFIRDGSGHTSRPIFSNVVTVNYDMVLELFFHKRNKNGVPVPNFDRRGFKQDNGARYLDLSGIINEQNKPEYVKLHGSIDWWQTDSGNIIESYPKDHLYETLIRRLIIYPIYEKHISDDPFFTLYQYFRRRLALHEDLTVIIGYSFRDPSVNKAFFDWLKLRENARLIVVSRKDNQQKIRNLFNGVDARIQFINEYFGDDNFIQMLIESLTTDITVDNN